MLSDLFLSLLSVKAKSRDEYLKEKFAEYADYLPPTDEHLSGKERLLTCLSDMVQVNSWEGNIVQNTAISTFIFGFAVGSFVRSRERIHHFQKKFDHMQFEGQYEASRKLADVTMLANLKSGGSLAFRFAMIPTICSAAYCCSLAYRNYVNPLDFAWITGTTAAIYKINNGPRAMASAAIFGSAFGLIGGCALWSAFKLNGKTVVEFRHWATARHKRTMETMSEKSWDDWSEKMKEFRSLNNHDQIVGIPRTSRAIEKSFDLIPDLKQQPDVSLDKK